MLLSTWVLIKRKVLIGVNVCLEYCTSEAKGSRQNAEEWYDTVSSHCEVTIGFLRQLLFFR